MGRERKWTSVQLINIIFCGLMQIFYFFPWLKYGNQHCSLHRYIFRALTRNDYIEAFNKTYYPGKNLGIYEQKMAILVLVYLMSFFVAQVVDLLLLYRNMNQIPYRDHQGLFWVIAMTWVFFLEYADYQGADEQFYIPMSMFIYLNTWLVVKGVQYFACRMTESLEYMNLSSQKKLEQKEQEVLELKVNVLEERFKGMLKSRQVVHDMKNHLLALRRYEQERDWDGIHEYLEKLSDAILVRNYQVWTGNQMLDMILNQKMQDAKDSGVQMTIQTKVFTKLPFTDWEIITLFGNLLDNALEATQKVTSENPWIHVKFIRRNRLFYVEIENSAEEAVKVENGQLRSQKEENGLHGYGMKNVREIVEKHEGDLQYITTDTSFLVSVSIYDMK